MVVINFNLEPVRSVGKPKHKRKAEVRANRGKFSKVVREQVKEHFNNECQECGTTRQLHIHHVKPKGSGVGRGVFTNALLLCRNCHHRIHNQQSQERLKYWQKVFRKKYGDNYYKDKQDLEREAWERVASETMDS